jgi:hypothetical protein
LHPFGEDGFTLQIPYKCVRKNDCKRKNVTMLEYNAYYLSQWPDESMLLLTSGHLSMQYWVDVYTCLEQNRLNWLRNNQGKLRTELYSGLQDALDRGDANTEQVGKRIYLPLSHTGSPRYMAQNLQDIMAICHWIGYPSLFITFTCNAKWLEIQYIIDASRVKQEIANRADIIVRVYFLNIFIIVPDTIEFKKRGLPHAHILIFLNDKTICHDTSIIDKFISAEIPDKVADPIGYTTVQNYMIHGLCQELNRNSMCMDGNKCTKHFPKRFNPETTIDEEGFSIYRR